MANLNLNISQLAQNVLPKASLPSFNADQFLQAPPAKAAPTVAPVAVEMRARLSALHPEDVYDGANAGGPGPLKVLRDTGGMLFPYAPTIAFGQQVSYLDLQLVHSNTDYPAYTRTPTCTLSVTGKFTVQNQKEGEYAIAAIHFLRTVSKSYFGEDDAKSGKAGLPPPVLLFSAYGKYMFNNLRVVLKSHSWSFDEAMDTILVKAYNVRVPALFTIQTELMVVQTPQRMRKKFSFDKFASGALMSGAEDGWV